MTDINSATDTAGATPPNPVNDGQTEMLNTEPQLQTEAAQPATNESGVPDAGLDTGNEAPSEPMSIDAIENEANAVRKEHNLPTLDDSVRSTVDTSPDLLKPLRDAVEAGVHYDWRNLLPDIYGLGQSAVYGLGQGAQETIRTGADVLGADPAHQLAAPFEDVILKTLFGKATMDGADKMQRDHWNQISESMPNIAELMGVPKPDTPLENLVGVVTPFIAATMLGEKPFQALGAVAKLNAFEIPGVVGAGLARMGVTPTRVGGGLLSMLKTMAAAGTVMPKDAGNFADMLDSFKSRKDLIGSASRVWLNSVPGEQWLVHDDSDDPLTAKFKNALDMGYGELAGALMYFTIRGARIGAMALKGGVAPEVLQQSVKDTTLVHKVMEKIGHGSSEPERWAALKAEGNAMSEGEALQNISSEGPAGEGPTLEGKVSNTDPVDAAPVDETVLDPTIDDTKANRNSGNDNVRPEGAPLPSLGKMGMRDRLLSAVDMDHNQLFARIAEAKASVEKQDRDFASNVLNYKDRFKNFIQRTGGVTERAKFDAEGYLNHIVEASKADNEGELHAAVHDWANFMPKDEEGNLPSLLTPRQLGAWDATPFEVTGNVVDSLKRLTTTNAARKESAARALAGLMGDASNRDNQKIAKLMLGDTARSTHEAQVAGQVQLMNHMYMTNTLMPDLEQTINVLKMTPDDLQTQKLALELLKTTNMYTEANKNLRSQLATSLQSTQIDPAIEQSLREIYGPDQYRAYFSPGEAKLQKQALLDGTEDAVTFDPNSPLTEGDQQTLKLLLRHYNVIEKDAKADWASSMFRANQHPVWKHVGAGVNFGSQLAEGLLMSSALYHPSTWSRVLQSSVLAGLYDSAGQALFAGGAVSKTEAAKLTYNAMWRTTSTPYSLWVASKSFIRPALKDTFNLGTNLYKHPEFMGHEMWANSFGEDFATKMFASAGGMTGRTLRTVGMAVGFPHHVLGSVETMLNHGALSSHLAGTLFEDALLHGSSIAEAHEFVSTHLPDVMEDAIVAKTVPRGNISLRNQVGYDATTLRTMVEQADQTAAYNSLRETGKVSGSPLATTKLGDTLPFQLVDGINYLLNKIPVVGPIARASGAPFLKVSANMASRELMPLQAAAEVAGRTFGMQGAGGQYVSEVMSGLHGPYRQAQLNGHTALFWALSALGAANMHHLISSGKHVEYALGSGPASEAGSEVGIKYGESPMPDGGALTTLGEAPFVSPYNVGNYLQWINERYSGQTPLNGTQDGAEAGAHLAQVGQVALPIAPMYQGLTQMLSDFNSKSGGMHGMNGWASGVGSMLRRPLRNVDLLPGAQTAGKSVAVTTSGYGKAFRTALGGPGGGPNEDRINAYDMQGNHIADKYDPDNKVNQHLEAWGFPVYRAELSKPVDQFMATLESHGISFPKAEPQQPLIVHFPGSPTEYRTPINMQLFYNPKSKQHLWDVYNGFIRDERINDAMVGGSGKKELTLKDAMNEVAKTYLDAERGPDGSKVMRYYAPTREESHLSRAANWMQTILLERREHAKNKLEQYLLEHGDEFRNEQGLTPGQYSKSLYHGP